MRADSGEGLLLRQSERDVVLHPITWDARSASPPLVYRISFPAPAFRGVASSPLRTAFSIGVASSRTNVRPNNSALPLSVNTSVALAICVLDTGFDGRGGREINEVRSRVLGGVDGRGCGIGGTIILVGFATGWRSGGGRTTTGAAVVAFTGAASTALGRGGPIWRNGRSGTGLSKGTTGPGCVLARCFGLGGSESALPKSERKLGGCRGGCARGGVDSEPSNCGKGLLGILLGEREAFSGAPDIATSSSHRHICHTSAR